MLVAEVVWRAEDGRGAPNRARHAAVQEGHGGCPWLPGFEAGYHDTVDAGRCGGGRQARTRGSVEGVGRLPRWRFCVEA